jgi:hypothetical protein
MLLRAAACSLTGLSTELVDNRVGSGGTTATNRGRHKHFLAAIKN